MTYLQVTWFHFSHTLSVREGISAMPRPKLRGHNPHLAMGRVSVTL